MDRRLEEILAAGPALTDGAWGTQMQARGLAIGECPDAWNLLYPDRVEQVARAYVDAGSRVILTNTFGASRLSLERHELGAQTSEINRAGARISRRSAGSGVRVFGSIGPCGRMLAAGDVSEDTVLAAFREQAQALAEGGVDGFVVETMSDLEEAALAVKAAARTGLLVVACMTFDSGKDGGRTMMGISPEEAAEGLAAAGASAIGANCGVGAKQMLATCRRLREATALPLWIKPNAGLPTLVDGRAVYHTSPGEFALDALALVEAGARFIGGCCGTGPEHIRALRQALDARNG